MREIKFRIYIHSEKRMIDAVGFCYEGVSQIRIWYKKDDSLLNESFLIVDTDTQQFTGLTDKNGKEIYEGDIVSWSHPQWKDPMADNPEDITEIGVVIWRDKGFWIDKEDFGWEGENLWHWDQLEVIGNIYENPELLHA